MEVRDSGKHNITELAEQIKGGSNALHKYTDFILSATPDKQTNLMATGSVHRGTHGILVLLPEPENASVFNDEISIPWLKSLNTDTYIVVLNDLFGDELTRLEISDTTVTLNFRNLNLVEEDNILLQVSSKDDQSRKSAQHMIKRLSPGERSKISESLAEIAELISEPTALNQLYLASFYENYSLLTDASTAYRKAISLAPSVPDFREAYLTFLIRNGLLKVN